jgi:hypothetical protein
VAAIFTFGVAAIAAAAGVTAAVTSEGIAVSAMIGLFVGLLGGTNTVLPWLGIDGEPEPPPFTPGLPPSPSFPLWSPTQLPPPAPTPSVEPLPAPVPTSGPAFYLGTITSANPNIWLYLPSLGSDRPQYIISTNRPPGDADDWFSVNQFCSLLSTEWLLNGNHPDNFTLNNNFTYQQIAAMALTLTDQDEGLQGQVNRAVQALGGQQQSLDEVTAGVTGSYPVGTRIWTGNDNHVVAVYINSATQYTVYDPNTGQTTTYARGDFSATVDTFGLNVFVVKTP